MSKKVYLRNIGKPRCARKSILVIYGSSTSSTPMKSEPDYMYFFTSVILSHVQILLQALSKGNLIHNETVESKPTIYPLVSFCQLNFNSDASIHDFILPKDPFSLWGHDSGFFQ